MEVGVGNQTTVVANTNYVFIMQINGVSEVQCAPEALTVVLEDNFKWEQVEPKVTAAVEAGLKQVQKETDDHVIEAVRYLIDVKVKPVLQGDGGDIRFEGFKDGVVSVSLHGACKGCPSSVITLKQGVEKYIKTHVPQVISVRTVDDDGNIQVERVDSEDEAIPVTQQEMQIRIGTCWQYDGGDGQTVSILQRVRVNPRRTLVNLDETTMN